MRFLWVLFAWMLILAGLVVFPPFSIIVLILLFVFREKQKPTTIIINQGGEKEK